MEVDVVLPGSCLGLWLRRQAFGAAALGQPLFKNILGYIWGMWRAAQVAEFALHVDDDVRLVNDYASRLSTCPGPGFMTVLS